MNITKITIGRLYNIGNYEHVRYELTSEIPPGESPATCIIGIEKILAALSPKTSTRSRDELKRDRHQIDEMRRRLGEGEDKFRSYYGSSFVGTPGISTFRVSAKVTSKSQTSFGKPEKLVESLQF